MCVCGGGRNREGRKKGERARERARVQADVFDSCRNIVERRVEVLQAINSNVIHSTEGVFR